MSTQACSYQYLEIPLSQDEYYQEYNHIIQTAEINGFDKEI